MSFKINMKAHFICIVISIILAIITYPLIDSVVANFIELGLIFPATNNILLDFYINIIILMIPITLVHESIHAIVYKIFGGEIKIGFKGVFAYTMEVSSLKILRVQFLLVLLAPITIVSIISLLLPAWLGGISFTINLLGSSGDIFMALYLSKVNFNSKIIDRIYGFDIV